MPALRPDVDPDGLMEFSVVFTDRSLNHMSAKFQHVMRDISGMLREVYGAEAVAVVPGGGTFAMEAVARQFATGAQALVVRNGWFSYRWTQILEAGGFAAGQTVVMARPSGNGARAPFAPPPIEGGGGEDRRGEAGCGLRAACRDLGRDHPARRLHRPDGGGRPCGRRADGARLHRLGLHLGRHGSDRGRCADLGAAEGLVGLARRGARDAVGPGGRAAGGHGLEQLRAGSEEMARDHGGLRGGRACLSHHHAHRCAAGLSRCDGRDEGHGLRGGQVGAVAARAGGARHAGRKGRGLGRGRGLRGSGRCGELHRRSRGADRPEVSGGGAADRGGRAAAGGRRGGVPHLPARALRARQARRCRGHGGRLRRAVEAVL